MLKFEYGCASLVNLGLDAQTKLMTPLALRTSTHNTLKKQLPIHLVASWANVAFYIS